MGPADRLRAWLGKAEVLNFAFPNQILDRSCHVFDRHVRVNAMLIEQIDDIGVQALERGLGDLLDVLRAAVERLRALPSGSLKPNLVAITTCLRNGARASPTSSSLMKGP